MTSMIFSRDLGIAIALINTTSKQIKIPIYTLYRLLFGFAHDAMLGFFCDQSLASKKLIAAAKVLPRKYSSSFTI